MEIINNLILDKKATELIDKLEPKELRDDMRNHLYLILADYDEKEIQKAFYTGYLNKLVGRIIISQFKSNTSDFWRIYRNGGFRKGYKYQEYFINIDIAEEYDDIELKFEYIKHRKKEIKDILKVRHWYHKKLFEMYFFENRTFQQIQEKTKINFQTVRNSILKTIDWIKLQYALDWVKERKYNKIIELLLTDEEKNLFNLYFIDGCNLKQINKTTKIRMKILPKKILNMVEFLKKEYR